VETTTSALWVNLNHRSADAERLGVRQWAYAYSGKQKEIRGSRLRLWGSSRRGRGNRRTSGPLAVFHILRGAPEPHDADVPAPIYPPYERLLKKVENHAAAVALYFMYDNLGRVHQTLRVTPAMEAGVTDNVWSVSEIVGYLVETDPLPVALGPEGPAAKSDGR